MVIEEAVRNGRVRLEEAGVPDAQTDVFLLLEAACGLSRAYALAHPEEEIPKEAAAVFDKYLLRRVKREPCQYITGSCEFYGLPFRVDTRVLIPRQDTEILVEEALKVLPEGGEVLDLCTGSGAIAVAIGNARPDAVVTATDLSEEALSLASENSRTNGCKVRFLQGDLFEAIEAGKRFDVICSNPPYVTEREYAKLMPEVKAYEPSLALLAGEDGLSVYRRLVAEAPRYLNSSGWLLVEIGCEQAQAVSQLFEEAGFQDVRVICDLAGLDRVVCGTRKG